MKNQIVNQMNDVIKEHGEKLHTILDEVVDAVNFKVNSAEGANNEMMFNPNTCVFQFDMKSYHIFILRDFVMMAVVVRMVAGEEVIAECSLNVANSFNEKYFSRMDKNIKNEIGGIFAEIEAIDINNVEAEPVPEQQEASEMPAEDVEVIEPKN